jgi:hypothetical protein
MEPTITTPTTSTTTRAAAMGAEKMFERVPVARTD